MEHNKSIGPKFVCFNARQPDGYLYSWLLSRLPITLWCGIAQKRFIQVKCFDLLSDDIVIKDLEVARVYRDVMNRIGVKISLAKTLTLDCGGLEFVKKFRVRNRELSPLSLKMIWSTRFSVAFMPMLNTIGSSSLLVSLRLKGAGYKQYSSSTKEYLNITDTGIGTFWWPSRLVESYHHRFLSS